MRPLRALLPLLRRQSLVLLAREAVWRATRPGRAARLRAMIQRGETRLRFRVLPYYQPDLDAARCGAAAIVAFADEICAGRFPLLGYETVALGFPPQWNLDFVSGFEWEQAPAAQVQPVVRHNGSDVKVPWELSRLQFLPVLAKAHLLSGQPHYREAAKTLFSDWNAKNPVGIGVNWTLAMETALRGMSLCFLLSLLQPLQPDEQAWGEAVTQSIWQHLLYTESCIEFSHLIRSNHYLGNLVGLHCMATFLDGPGMERRRRKYRFRIEQEILRHVYSDGGDYEASFSYHLLVLQMFTSAYLLMRADQHTANPKFVGRLRAMFHYLAELASENGRVPHIGDTDDGRVELFVSDLSQMVSLPRDERDSLIVPGYIAIGNALFQVGNGSDPSDAAWYGLRPEPGAAKHSRLTVFAQSGVAIARLGACEAVFCAIPNGIRGAGSHTHNDKLSVIVRIRGTELFCDSGTCCYTRNPDLRNQFRATDAHNTVVIDGAEQNDFSLEPQFVFCMGDQAAVSPIEIRRSEQEIRLLASHSGYARLGVKHQRSLQLLQNSILVEDALSGNQVHSFQLFWHLPAIWHVDQTEENGFEIGGPLAVRLAVSSGLMLRLSHEPVSISRTYGGAVEKGTRLRIAGYGRFPCTIRTQIAWRAHASGRSELDSAYF